MKTSQKVIAVIIVILFYAVLFYLASKVNAENAGLHFTF